MSEHKIIQIAVNESGTTCLTDDGRVWYWTTAWIGDIHYAVWKEMTAIFVDSRGNPVSPLEPAGTASE